MPILGHRESPRPRHELPRPVLFMLWPLFRYSDWRDAWILRIAGEWWGPVLRPAPPSERALRLRGLRAPALLVACAIVVAGVLGFVAARSANGGGSTARLGPRVSAGVIEVAFPRGWRRQPARESPRLALIDGLGASSGDRSIVVGIAATTDPSLLPAGLLDAVRGGPTPELVSLRGTTFYRYSRLSPVSGRGAESAYAAPTLAGTVLAICRASKPASDFAMTCQRVVRSISLRSGSLAPGLVPAYASRLRTVIDGLNAARTSWGSQLSAARTARLQARAATQLGAAYADAAAALAGLSPGPARFANAALVGALRADDLAYRALARAAAHGRVRAYREAVAAIAQANATLGSDLAALGAFGYRVS